MESRFGMILRAAVHLLFNVGSIHEKSVGIFPLPADRLVPRIQVAGRRNRHGDAGHHDRIRRLRRHRHDAGLKRQQIGEAPSVQRNGGHHRAGNDIAHLCAFSFNLHRVCLNRYFARSLCLTRELHRPGASYSRQSRWRFACRV